MKDEMICAVALLVTRGCSRDDVANHLGIAESTISKHLDEARKRGWLTECLNHSVPMDVRELGDKRVARLENEVASRLKRRSRKLKRVLVFPSSDSPEIADQLRTFAFGAAEELKQLFRRDFKTCGVAWGSTVSQVVKALPLMYSKKSSKKQTQKLRSIEFVPICGEPLGVNTDRSTSSTFLATLLNEVINHGRGNSHSLYGVPAFVPRVFSDSERATIETLFRFVPSYKAIFPPKYTNRDDGTYLAERLDVLITSGMPSEQAFGNARAEFMQSAGLDADKVYEIAWGDIAGVLLPRPKGEKVKEEVALINQCWTGLTMEQLRQVDTLVLMCVNKNKACLVKEALRENLVTELWIDQNLAEELQNEQ